MTITTSGMDISGAARDICRSIFNGELPFSGAATEMTDQVVDAATRIVERAIESRRADNEDWQGLRWRCMDDTSQVARDLVPTHTPALAARYAATYRCLDYDGTEEGPIDDTIARTLRSAYRRGINTAVNVIIDTLEEINESEQG